MARGIRCRGNDPCGIIASIDHLSSNSLLCESLGQQNVHCVGIVLLKTLNVHEIMALEVCEILDRVSVIQMAMSKESRLPRVLGLKQWHFSRCRRKSLRLMMLSISTESRCFETPSSKNSCSQKMRNRIRNIRQYEILFLPKCQPTHP